MVEGRLERTTVHRSIAAVAASSADICGRRVDLTRFILPLAVLARILCVAYATLLRLSGCFIAPRPRDENGMKKWRLPHLMDLCKALDACILLGCARCGVL